MHRDPDGVDLWRAEVTPDEVGAWTFAIEGWGDPVATWRHNAEIKIPAGIDVELMFTEGARCCERAATSSPRQHEGRPVAARDAVKAMP